MRQVWMTKVGPPETLQLREAPDPEPTAGTIRIRAKACGVNFADIMARLGLYPDAPKLPAVVGYEVAGVVDAVGAGIKTFKEGDRVIGICRFGGYSDTVVLPEVQVYPLPQRFTFAQGAALPVNYLTAYQMLFVMGSLRAGDRVLVHSAGGGVGLAAVQLGRLAGAEMIGIASTQKHPFLAANGYSHTIDRRADFEAETKRLTGGRGVQIVLDPVGGESWAKGLRALAPTGRLVVFGFSGAATSKRRNVLSAVRHLAQVPWLRLNPLTLMNENKAVVGVNLGHLWDVQDMVKRWAEQLLVWCEEGKIQPNVDKEFPLAEAAAAHHYIQDRRNLGKVVLVT